MDIGAIFFIILGFLVTLIGLFVPGNRLLCFGIGTLFILFGYYLIEKNDSNQKANIQDKNNQAEIAEEQYQKVQLQALAFLHEMGLPEDTSFYKFNVNNNYDYLAFFDLPIPYFLYARTDGYQKLPLKCIIEVVSEAEYVINKKIERQGTIKRAIVGSILAGGTGAIIGGTTGDSIINEETTLSDAWMRIQTNEVAYRTFIIHAPNKATANDYVAIVKAIASKYQNCPKLNNN